ncbi:MAG: hypothetical protein ACOX2F_07995 [bacterium]
MFRKAFILFFLLFFAACGNGYIEEIEEEGAYLKNEIEQGEKVAQTSVYDPGFEVFEEEPVEIFPKTGANDAIASFS